MQSPWERDRLALTEHERRVLAEVVRILEAEEPGVKVAVRVSLAVGSPGGEILWIDATRIREGVPQEPTVRNLVSRAMITGGDVEALAEAIARSLLREWRWGGMIEAVNPMDAKIDLLAALG